MEKDFSLSQKREIERERLRVLTRIAEALEEANELELNRQRKDGISE